MALTISGLCTSVGGREVLTGVNLDVPAGSFVGLVGPNGAGKTTFLRSILGLIPHKGRVEVGAANEPNPTKRWGKWGKGRRPRAGYVPQSQGFAWDFPINVEDAVLTGRVIRPWQRVAAADYRAVGHALEQVQLRELKARPVAELSGGQKQRVLVARALVSEAPLLLLDEPFTGVDVPTQELLTDLFIRLSSEGMTVIMATHDLVAATHTCTHLAMLKGTIRAFAPPAQLTGATLWHEVFGLSAGSPLLGALAGAGNPAGAGAAAGAGNPTGALVGAGV